MFRIVISHTPTKQIFCYPYNLPTVIIETQVWNNTQHCIIATAMCILTTATQTWLSKIHPIVQMYIRRFSIEMRL